MRLLLYSCILLFTWGVNAQTSREQQIDSLQNKLKVTAADTTKVNILCQLSNAYHGIDSIKTFETAEKALRISKKINYLRGITKAYIRLGEGHSNYSSLDKAIEYLTKGSELGYKLIKKDSSKQNVKTWAYGHHNLGINYAIKGDYDSYLRHTQEVIPYVEAMGDDLFLASIHTNLGVGNINLEQYESALKSLKKASAIYAKLNQPKASTYTSLSLAKVFYHFDSLNRMKKVLKTAELNLKKYPNNFDNYNFHTHEAMYYEGKGLYKQAITALDNAAEFVQGNKNSISHTNLYEHYAKIYESSRQYTKALEYNDKYLENAKINGSAINISKAYKTIARVKAADNDFRGAYKDAISGFAISDSLEKQQYVAKLADLELKYSSEKKEKEIVLLQQANTESALSLEQKKSQSYLQGGIIGLLGLFLFGGYYAYRQRARKARKKELMQEAELEGLKQEQQNKIFSAMIEGQEKERKRLAIDLHDGLGGRLSGISMNLSKLDKDEPKEYPKKQLQKVMKDLNDSLTELRGIARNMMPETLVKFGLQAALKDYCSSMTGEETKVTLQFYGDDKDININQQVTMYRVIQELINNAIKHAKATGILVQYMREGNQVDITVEDNGIGFDKSKVVKKKDSGMGLSNLQTRVAYLKGNIDFESEANKGTTVNVNLNVDAA